MASRSRRIGSSCSVENTTVPPGPIAFDRYIATSAWLRSDFASVASRGNTPMPSDALMVKSTPSRVNGSLKSSCTRRARSSMASSAASVPGDVAGSPAGSLTSIKNSSPL